MKALLSPKNDFVFKKLFTTNTEILADLINSVLELSDQHKIVSLKIKNPDIMPDEVDMKYIILDIRAVDGEGNEYDIEIQVRKYENYPQRTLYYLCRMYGDQLKSGEDYSELHPVIGIHFLDYEHFTDTADFHYHFRLKDTRYPKLTLTDDLSLHIFELPGIEKYIKGNNLQEWLYFFNNAHKEREETMKENYNNPMIHKAFQNLAYLSADEITRDLAERREKALKDEAMFLNEARRQGKKEGRKEAALKLLKMNVLTVKQIAEATESDIEEIEKLRQEFQKIEFQKIE